MATIFDKIISKEIPASIVYETDEVLAFKDINPQAPVHVLVIPKKAISQVHNITDDDAALMGKLLIACRDIVKSLGIDETGYRLAINNGKDASQSVDHIHIHILGGRVLGWPPG